ncbi:MAG: class I SAM-dependent methyltransferase [Chloroflexi bacterium]|nr:class I SAM-dependent methyltransferase [Chloroflexota bacterium]
MRVIVGREQHELTAAELRERAAAFERVAVDVGTGSGRAVLAEATAEPRTLVVGLDADAASMVEASRRAAAAPARGGRPNALFVVGGAEELPGPFESLADAVFVRFPWGSLLRGSIGEPGVVETGLAGMLRPGGELTLLLALQPKDGHDDLMPLVADPPLLAARLGELYGPLGLALEDCRWATAGEVAEAHSSWARRLRVGRDRQAVLARLRRLGLG